MTHGQICSFCLSWDWVINHFLFSDIGFLGLWTSLPSVELPSLILLSSCSSQVFELVLSTFDFLGLVVLLRLYYISGLKLLELLSSYISWNNSHYKTLFIYFLLIGIFWIPWLQCLLLITDFPTQTVYYIFSVVFVFLEYPDYGICC